MRASPNPGPLPQPQLDGDVWDLRFIENNYNPDRSIQLSPEVLSNPRHAVSRFMQTGLGANPTFTTTSGYVGRQQYFRYVTFFSHLVFAMKYTSLHEHGGPFHVLLTTCWICGKYLPDRLQVLPKAVETFDIAKYTLSKPDLGLSISLTMSGYRALFHLTCEYSLTTTPEPLLQ